MGQRHQIYVVLPKDHHTGKRVIGIHHQWLYGHTAARLCERFLTFILQAKKVDTGSSYHPFANFDNPQPILEALYSCDAEEGYFHNVCALDVECDDPRKGDNNDGITVFDLRRLKGKKGRIGYCFASLDGHHDLPELRPLSAREYVRGYYPEAVDAVRVPGFKVCRLPSGEKNDAENRVRAVERLRVPVMTPKDLHEIWPEVFPEPRQPPKLVLPDLEEPSPSSTVRTPPRGKLTLVDLGDHS